MKTIHFEIVTPDGPSFKGEVESIVIPAWEGQLGILPGREPLVALLKPGELRYTQDGKSTSMAVSGGFAQVTQKKVVVLAETAELASQIDEARAKARLAQKQEALKGAVLMTEEQMTALQAGLLKEIMRIKIAEKARKG